MMSGIILAQFRRKCFSFSLHLIPYCCVTCNIALKQPSKLYVLKLNSSVFLLLYNKLIYIGRTKLSAKRAAANKENPYILKN
jgi:hypothetical protein